VDELWSYANTGYWLTGLAAAERFGGTFEDALHATVLAPAGLDATDFGEPDVPGHAVEPPPVAYPRARRPSGGLTSTVADLLRLGRWHLAQPWLEPARTVRAKPVGGVYGLGLFGERVGGEDVWGHSGSWGGFQSSWLTIPSRGAVFAGLTNHELGGKAVKQVEDVFFRAAVGEPRRRPQHVSLQPEQYDAFTGRYENTDGSYVVRREPGQDGLTLEAWDEVLEARAIGERTFAVAAGNHVDERFDFPREGFGRFGSRLAARTA
jgi:CubicO group peptidase (beta-lactamase class C family)